MDAKDIVMKTATLAHLEFNAEEIDKFADSFKNVLEYVDTINKIDLSGVEPLAHINEAFNNFREDVEKPSIPIASALKNAPKKNDNFYKVPKVLE